MPAIRDAAALPRHIGVVNPFPLLWSGFRNIQDAPGLTFHRIDPSKPHKQGTLDIVLFDPCSYPEQHRWTALTKLVRDPHVKSAYLFSGYLPQEWIVEAQLLGARGLISKSLPTAELCSTLMELATHPREHHMRTAPPVPPPSAHESMEADLTAREAEVLALIAAGRSNQEIAEKLVVSINSVKSYIRTAYRKAGITSRTQAVLWALDNGLGDSQATSHGAHGSKASHGHTSHGHASYHHPPHNTTPPITGDATA